MPEGGMSPTNPGQPVLPSRPPTGGGAKPPATGPDSATALRIEAAQVQAQLDKLQQAIADRDAAAAPGDATGPHPQELTAISSLNTRLTALATAISTAESRAPAVIAGGTPADHFIIRQNPDGTIATSENPNWDHKSDKPQVVSNGNRIFTVGNDGKVTVAYTDADAQNLAARQADVAEKNAATAAAAQATTDAATRAKIDLENRVANGEDAASVRAQQAQDLTALHDSWVRADGDARRAQQDLRDYNTERHQTAQDTLNQQQLQQTAEWQKQQDATTRRAQDLGQQTAEQVSKNAQAATQASLTNARVGAAGGYAGNVMQLLNSLNKDVAPGSGAVGNMLVPMLMLGQEYFKQMAGGQGAASVNDPNAAAPSTTTPVPDTTAPVPDLSVPSPATPTAPAPIGSSADWYTQWQARQEADRQAQLAAASPIPYTQSGMGEGSSRGLPGYAAGGIVTKPTVAMVGEQGPEAIVPLSGPSAGGGMDTSSGSSGGGVLQIVGAFLSALANANAGGGGGSASPLPTSAGPGDPAAALAGQAAAATGNPPEAGANPMLPGSAVPGVPPQAAGAAATARPLGPDGSPYITPADVAARLQARQGGATPAPAGAGG